MADTGGVLTIGICSNTASGLPGNAIVSAMVIGSSSGCVIDVGIPRTRLHAGTKYWIEENAQTAGENSANLGLWYINESDPPDDLYQYHDYYEENGTVLTNYTSGWLSSNQPAPYAEVK